MASPRLLLAGLAALAAAACAHSPPATVASDVCAQDAARLCPGVAPGEGRVLRCLRSKEVELTPACQLVVTAPQETLAEAGEACRMDANRLCPDMRPGDGKLMDCLRSRWDLLFPGCREAMWAAQEKRDQFQAVCGKDLDRWCKGIRPGEGRVVACLKQHAGDLSAVCRELAGL
jgi:hypothetical protein